MILREDGWLAGVFGHAVYRVELAEDELEAPALARELKKHDPERAFYYVKVPTTSVATVSSLCALGFNVIDVNVTLSAAGDLPSMSLSADARVVPIEPVHHEAILNIAKTCFDYSRFHLDPKIPRDIANSIKREWIANYVRGHRGEALYAALYKDEPAGFLAVLADDSGGGRRRVIDLIGVDRKAQGKGVGRTLVRFFLEHYRRRCDELLVGTQAANVPSLRLYEGCGFRVARASYVLHRHSGR